MKYWQAEYEAIQFAKGYHTLQEWADYGFNQVMFEDKAYYEGKLDGQHEIEDKDVMCELSYWDIDEDGYKVWYVERVKE